MPAGKAMAMAAMPTAVIVGMGFTASLAVADNNKVAASPTETMNAEDYQACVEALKADKDKSSQSPSPSASASASESAKESTPSPSATATGSGEESSPDKAGQDKAGQGTAGRDEAASGTSSSDKAAPGTSSSSDSGSDDKGGPAASGSGAAGTTPSPSATEKKDGGLLGAIGDAIGDTIDGIGNVLTGGKPGSGTASSPSASPTPSASASPSASTGTSGSDQGGSAGSGGKSATDTVKDTADKAAGTVKDTVDGVTDTASKAAEEAKEKAEEATSSPSPSPSASASVDPEECPAATDAEGGVDNKIPLPDDPWYLNASSLTLKGAHYKGVVEVRTANGTVKKVLKYVISAGTDIGDLHQTVKDKLSGKTYHVQAAKGSTSTITDGDTVMYTESISGNLLGLIPITFSPDSPPPLDIPLIYFTKVKVVQAGQFGGTLKVPGLHQYTTDGG
ncbi:hypothetical protein ACF1BS_35435 [Streptomyces sp. NPDC014748]|uniref:hypothetical protein n=1 Tax=Streptomyces sp. NPDC014748 TaxID=3364905 RepID=UPI0036FEDA89